MTSLLPLASQTWEFLDPRDGRWLAARVPGCVHLDLWRHGLIPDPFYGSNELGLRWIERENWTYRTAFDLDEAFLARETIELVADGLDTLATLTLNGREIARTESMFTGYRFSVKEALRPGRNELVVAFANPLDYVNARRRPDDVEWNDPVGGCSHIRKQQCSFGWDWGPRFATSGIYRDIRLEAWSGGRILGARVRQTHRAPGGAVTLHIVPNCRLACPAGRGGGGEMSSTPAFACRLSFGGEVVAQSSGTELTVSHPRLWWPNGHGEQPLYDLRVDLLDAPGGAVVDTWETRVGLRTVVLDRHPDEYGESFQFVVNGQAIFAKGANWIPAHSFVSQVTRADYDALLTDATDVHMNMLRVWGGGIYESDDFYDLCDEKGLLVWQDFMFACAMYPGHEAFLKLVQAEAEYQVARLAPRACLALWCGNNEIEQMATRLAEDPRRAADYRRIFEELLPAAVARHDGVTTYWPCSPHDPTSDLADVAKRQTGGTHVNAEGAGDSHFWDVWHARKPVKTYEEKRFRFCSEFGMQSYSSPEVAATFCPPEEFNVFSPAMENHQKNGGGNATILDYVARLYRFPKDFESLSYLSQLNQLWCLKVGVEHFRRSLPRTMGALYWQLNDCWPVFSWSSVEFGGKWKALHYGARRFFAPALVSAHVPGDEKPGVGNYLKSTIHEVNLFTVYDGREPETAAHLAWELRHLDGRRLEHGGRAVTLRCNESVLQARLDFAGAMAEHGAGNLYLRVMLTVGGRTVSEDTVFLTAPRFLDLPRAPIETGVTAADGEGEGVFDLEFRSAVFQHRVKFELGGLALRASDNFFDLHPHHPRRVRVRLARTDAAMPTAAELATKLTTLSLADSY